MTGTPHYFIGVPISEEIRQVLGGWQKELKQVVQYKTWTHPEDFHITLKFLGAVDTKNINEVLQLLKEETASYPAPFHVETSDLKFFGQKQKPRVLFMEVEKHTSLLNLKEIVETRLKRAGFQEEKRPYRPHITIAKKWKEEQKDTFTNEKLENLKETLILPVDRFHVFRIHPAKAPKYEIVETIELG
ncbi:2'-5' RNA ligase [Thalassobacillus cyri]|uniref:RNA 2',3'-cyclic phosphodiesterase n=1 Tax=Thalassobacillus cyri TaxID=571932 RepID=A0A1H4BFC8_9BACI|nr:RNA 2',3'-cyclic phosphodiesterase [Thalassobacillus cyri]SEA46859.1 2'-5' RNA ligase [Thalassobacillus cyri]